jgi:DNA ligase-1
MEGFASMVAALDRSNSTLDKVAAMRAYLLTAPDGDCAWAVYFLAGGRPRTLVATRLLREAAREAAGVPEWLFDECYQAVGDLAETIALLLPESCEASDAGGTLDTWMRSRLLPLRDLDPDAARAALIACWRVLDSWQRFVFNKLLTGGLRLGVSRQLVLRALAEASAVDARLIAQRIIGFTDRKSVPDGVRYRALVAPAGTRADADRSPPLADGTGDAARASAATATDAGQSSDPALALLPYPFMLAHSWEPAKADAEPAAHWLAEWKWDGIRVQLVRRTHAVALWSRGEELLTDRFPEIVSAAQALAPGTVLDGELLCWAAGAPRPMDFAAMQTRIGRLRPGATTLRQTPARLVVFDCLEHQGVDLRGHPLRLRRQALFDSLALAAPDPERLCAASAFEASTWSERAGLREAARTFGAEGLMLKRLDSAYGIGRSRADGGHWFKWKLDPFAVDAVLIYAQAGHGRRAGLYTDYTFAVWDRSAAEAPRLVPFAKAYSGLTDAEIREVDAIIRRTTVERFGPVRSVEPTLVFEIGFEGIARSARHRAGVSVRFPRMLRWRRDKGVAEADSLASLQGLLAASRG